jgi:serpin B
MKSVLAAVLAVWLIPVALVAQSSAPAADQTALAQGNNAFAVDLYGQLRAQPGNLFFSPESISTAFAMAYAGARGQTATQMQRVFHYTLPPEKLHPAMGALLKAMNAPHQDYELHTADALWAEEDATFLPDYLKLMQDDYGAGLRRVDFEHAPEAVRGTINQWVAQETNNRIQNLIGPGVLTPQTRLVLTNAIYFKGTWLDQFPASYTELAMVVLLPKQKDGLAALEKRFTAAAASTWIERLKPADKVIVTLPRFTMTQQFELNGALSALGMPQAFSGSADFSGMTGKPEFTISAAIHKAFIAAGHFPRGPSLPVSDPRHGDGRDPVPRAAGESRRRVIREQGSGIRYLSSPGSPCLSLRRSSLRSPSRSPCS